MRKRVGMSWVIKLSRIGMCVVIAGLILSLRASYAQTQQPPNTITPLAIRRWESSPRAPLDDITPQQYARIQAEIARNRMLLIKQGKLRISQAPFSVPFIFPLRVAPGTTADYGFYTRAQFVDHNPAYPNQVLDYNNGNRTYDTTTGYNHPGTDIALFPFAWQKMDADAIQVVAVAAGTIVGKEDGNFDRNCAGLAGTGNANTMYVQHNDGTTTWYIHLKNGSLTKKNVGDTVVAGEYLGVVGSSGNSTGPHLHFEVHNVNGDVVDPYFGPANTIIGKTLWDQQPDYYDSAINHIGIGLMSSVTPPCPADEISNEQTSFPPDSIIHFNNYYREFVPGQISQYAIYRPDNSLFYQGTNQGPQSYIPAYVEDVALKFPSTAPEGTWRYEVVYQGHTYQQAFSISTTTTPGSQKFTVYLPLATH